MGLGDVFNALLSSMDKMVSNAERKTYNDLSSQARNYDGSDDSKSGFNQSMENFEKVSQMRGQMDGIMGRSGASYERREQEADRFYEQAKSNVSSSESKRRF